MAQINYESVAVVNDGNNNISNPNLLNDISNKGGTPFIFGVSKFGDKTTFESEYKGFMGLALSSSTVSTFGDYEFPTPYPKLTITSADSLTINGLVMNFDAIVNQFPTRILIDGISYNVTGTSAKIASIPDTLSHTIEFIAWNTPGSNIRMCHIAPTDELHLDLIKIAPDRASLNDPNHVFIPKMFSDWKTQNTLTYASSPDRVSAGNLNNMTQNVYYIPRVDFTYNYLSPEEHSKFIQAVNRREFVVEYFDTEMLATVVRKMYTSQYGVDRFVAFGGIYRGASKTSMSFVSKLPYKVRNDNNQDIGYDDLYAKATVDDRIS